MPFILLGIIMIIMGGYFSYLGKKQEKREMALGAFGLIVAGVLLSVIFIILTFLPFFSIGFLVAFFLPCSRFCVLGAFIKLDSVVCLP